MKINERESKSLEFKSQPPKFESLVKTCIAFANGMGGRIYIGIEDKTGQIIGVDNEIRNRIYDEFLNSLYDSTNPGLLVLIYEKNLFDKTIMIIEVPPSSKKPCFYKKEGIPKGVYLRVGSSTRKATPEYIEGLMRESRRITFDEEPVLQKTEILSKELLAPVYGKSITARRLLGDKVICRSSSNLENYHPTIAGVIHYCENPEQYIPEAQIICTLFKGFEGRDIIQSHEVTGNLEQQSEGSLKLLTSLLSRNFELKGSRLSGKSLLPEKALREAIINALIHRKYNIPGAIKIAVFEDRVEIFNPGSFPGLVDIDHLGDGTTFLRLEIEYSYAPPFIIFQYYSKYPLPRNPGNR